MCSISEVVLNHSFHTQRLTFEKLFGQISALLNHADNCYSFSGMAILVGNNTNEDHSLARAHMTPKLSHFAEACCMADSMDALLGHARSLAHYETHRQVVKDDALGTLQQLGYNISNEMLATFCQGTAPSLQSMTVTVTPSSHRQPSTGAQVVQPKSLQPSETELMKSARKAVLLRAAECSMLLSKLQWKTLDAVLLDQGYQIINYPVGVTLPWDISTPLATKGISSSHHLQFRKSSALELSNNKVPLLVFSPDTSGNTKDVFASSLAQKVLTQSRRQGKEKMSNIEDIYEEDNNELAEETPTVHRSQASRAKSQPPQLSRKNQKPLMWTWSKGKDVSDIDSSYEEDNDELEEETPTVPAARAARAKSQPPRFAAAPKFSRAMSQPPAVETCPCTSTIPSSVSKSSVTKRVTWDLSNAPKAQGNGRDVVESVSAVNAKGFNFTSEESVARLRNNGGGGNPSISMQDLVGSTSTPTAIKHSSSTPPPGNYNGHLPSKEPRHCMPDPPTNPTGPRSSHPLPQFPAFGTGTVTVAASTSSLNHSTLPNNTTAAPVQQTVPTSQATPTTVAPPHPYWQQSPHAMPSTMHHWPSGTLPQHAGYPSMSTPTPQQSSISPEYLQQLVALASSGLISPEQFQQLFTLATSGPHIQQQSLRFGSQYQPHPTMSNSGAVAYLSSSSDASGSNVTAHSAMTNTQGQEQLGSTLK
ncbi:hypothetical protein E1B28_013086 [Marasmius oreades]|uniref:Uncharacterized protein n=1 Tax=Marasmius oreades TaxID=181124 RepID=A0A9P7RP70_9AGAR|nr:uncharacterized protein E1B28_013086 [Marasmius oreades]KAG7087105.1 hypothetical protein E1B28_013086 [Marasmius oreades]